MKTQREAIRRGLRLPQGASLRQLVGDNAHFCGGLTKIRLRHTVAQNSTVIALICAPADEYRREVTETCMSNPVSASRDTNDALGALSAPPAGAMDYSKRVEQQIGQYSREGAINPPVTSATTYFKKRYQQERFRELFGVRNHIEFYYAPFVEAMKRTNNFNLISIGSGDCALEIDVAKGVRASGITEFEFFCLELSPVLVERARRKVSEASLGRHFHFLTMDVADWRPDRRFAGCMAHHSLHHIVALEHLFSTIRNSLEPGGYFLSCDVIGRNGHLRWPETLKIMEKLWALLPEEKRYHHALKTTWREFVNFDCSTQGFEGIRAQDILQLLLDNFSFDVFLPYGGLIEVFMSPGLGPNFNMELDWDRNFIDLVAHLNDILVESGHIKPTLFFAKMSVGGHAKRRFYKHLSPEFCVRVP